MSESPENGGSKKSNSPKRKRSRSPRAPPPPPPPPPPLPPQGEADLVAADIARRTCSVCFRQFDSVKAMYGHLWVHRERDRNQVYGVPPPPPPPPPGVAGGVGVVAVAGGVGGLPWHPWKIDSLELRDRTCPRCMKVFGSPKAMFGHLHIHNDKSSSSKKCKGESSTSQPCQMVALVDPAANQEQAIVIPEAVMEEDNLDDDQVSRLSIDLNKPIFEMDDDDEEESSNLSIDLNRSPPRH